MDRMDLFRAVFCVFLAGRAVLLLLPALVAVQLFRKQAKMAWRTSWCSAVVLTLAGAFESWVARLPVPPHQTVETLGRHAMVCNVVFAVGMASAFCLFLAVVVPLFRKQRERVFAAGMCSAVVLPPFLWLVCLMTDAWPWIVWWVWRTTGWHLPLRW